MIELSNGVKISEDTVVSALKKAGIKVEPLEPKVLLYGTTKGTDDDIYLKFIQLGCSVEIDSVTKDGSWRKHICVFRVDGLRLHTSANGAGFPVTDDYNRKIKLV